jgi:hypothetical protein
VNQPIDPTVKTLVATIPPTIGFGPPFQFFKIRFNDVGINWGMVDKNEILLRLCYESAIAKFDLLRANQTAFGLVEGSSGIGKTVWIFYFIYRKTRGSIDLPFDDPNKPTFCYQDPDKNIFYFHYSAAGQPIVTKGKPADIDPHYFISDTIPRITPSANVLQLHVVSIGNQNMDFQHFMGDRDNKDATLFPPFSREEHLWCDGIKDALGNWTNQEELQFLYDVFGGCIRLLHKNDPSSEVPGTWYDFSFQELNTFFTDVHAINGQSVNTFFVNQIIQCARTIAVELRRIETRMSSSSRTLFQHTVLGARGFQITIPSSKFMDYFGATISEQQQVGIWRLVKELFEGSGAGIYFEKCAHEEVIRRLRGSGLTVKKITAKTTKSDNEIIQCNIIRKVLIRTWNDITNLQPNEYGLPIVPNFSLIDSVVRRDGTDQHLVFQMTIQELGHSSRAVIRERELFNAFTNQGKIKMINVLHPDNYEEFHADPDLPIARWEQFKAYGVAQAMTGQKRKSPQK